jgi:hypothetical protein
MKFTKYWNLITSDTPENSFFWKSTSAALTEDELVAIQNYIYKLQDKGLPSGKIIAKLQEYNSKLTEKYRAERVFWTEVKRRESAQVAEAGDNLELEKYRVILSPHACDKCRAISKNGTRIWDSNEIADAKDIPPFHPNCYCALIPTT